MSTLVAPELAAPGGLTRTVVPTGGDPIIERAPEPRRPIVGRPIVGLVGRHALGLGAGIAGLLIMFWGLGRPALWLDESASAVATTRTWPNLWLLLQGTDSPLVPYYALLKLQRDLAVQFFPAAGSHLEVLLRWPSAIAIAVACWVLVSWLRSAASASVASCCAAVLLLIEGVSRYGQEARPYGLVLMMAIISTAVWWRLMKTRSPWTAGAYATCVAALVCLHALAALLVLAHLVAALLIRRDELLIRILLTIGGATAGVLVTSPLTIAAVVQGGGATRYQHLTGPNLLNTFASLFGGSAHPDARFLIVAALAAIGLTRWNSRRYADITRVAACWALIPALVIIPAMTLRPNLLLARYVLFVIPGWAILAGLGLGALAEAAHWGVAGRSIGSGSVRRFVAVVCSGAMALGVVIVLAALQWPTLATVRGPAGHGENVLPVLAKIDRLPYRSLPIIVSAHLGSIEFGAYAPAEAPRVISMRQQTDQKYIWPEVIDRPTIKEELRLLPTIILVTRKAGCDPMPGYLKWYRITDSSFTPGDWSFYVLHQIPRLPRMPRPASSQIPPALAAPPRFPCQLSPSPGVSVKMAGAAPTQG
jgi:mannosyltransferase